MRSNYKTGDYYNKKARDEGMPARSVYKLEELDTRFKLLFPGQVVLDLGAAPGSWTRYAAMRVGAKGVVYAYDLSPLAGQSLLPNVVFTRGDVLALLETALPASVDVVLSDMAPGTTGDRFSDAARSHELCMKALAIAERVLKLGGGFACKVFEGEDTRQFLACTRALFPQVKPYRPKATRANSREIFVIGQGFTGGNRHD